MAKILIVDDKPVNRQVLKEILKYSHEILEADDGEKALVLARDERPDLVITDILMPTMDGYDFVHSLRSDTSVPYCPVIFYTAFYHEWEARSLADACGVTQIIYKPCEPEKVLKIVSEALGQAAPPAPLPPDHESTRQRERMLADKLARQVEKLECEMLVRKSVEEELRRAKEAAEAATEAKTRFLANMSHELRTPMTGVLGMLDLALTGDLNSEQKQYIGMARSSAHALLRILNDILDLTKIEAGKLPMEEKAFSPRYCVENTFNILHPLAKNKGLDLDFTVDADVPKAMIGDQFRLNQVLTNLAANAVKFTEKGKVEIRVEAGKVTPDGKRELIFTVTDTGIGIPDDKKHLLFQSFSQVDESHSRAYGGAGLGLVISREIVERMGGTITFMTEEGKGSAFTFTVPLAETGEGLDTGLAPEKTTPAPAAPRTGEGTRPRILIAEDDDIIRRLLGMMFKKANYEVEFAENGRKTVEMWENGKYDLILMDVQMPQVNGFEATCIIREKERVRGGHIPIVAMTAHTFKEDHEKCLAVGMDYHLPKPIEIKKCLSIIGDILEQSGTG